MLLSVTLHHIDSCVLVCLVWCLFSLRSFSNCQCKATTTVYLPQREPKHPGNQASFSLLEPFSFPDTPYCLLFPPLSFCLYPLNCINIQSHLLPSGFTQGVLLHSGCNLHTSQLIFLIIFLKSVCALLCADTLLKIQ